MVEAGGYRAEYLPRKKTSLTADNAVELCFFLVHQLLVTEVFAGSTDNVVPEGNDDSRAHRAGRG